MRKLNYSKVINNILFLIDTAVDSGSDDLASDPPQNSDVIKILEENLMGHTWE